MNEVWKDIYFIENGIIYDYRKKYQVSNLGNVKSLNYRRTGKEKELVKNKTRDGYYVVRLLNNGIENDFSIHRLVAHMFIENPENKPYIDHINAIRTDNRVENLRWCIQKENINNLHCLTKMRNRDYSNMNMEKSIKHNKENYSIPIVRIDKENKIKFYNSINDTKLDGFHQGHVCECCQGKLKSHKKYKWMYVDDYAKYILHLD